MADTAAAAPPRTLAERLAAWIDAEGIKGHYDTAGIAERVTAQLHPDFLESHLARGSGYLRDMCRRVRDLDDMTLEEQAAEDYRHGHGRKPRKSRRGQA